MTFVCEEEMCTGCGACIAICPHSCISFIETLQGEKKAKINSTNCVNCGLCLKACHINNKSLAFYETSNVFATWSSNLTERIEAASGGLASAIYNYSVSHGLFTMGTRFSRESGVDFQIVKNQKDIQWANNSKYVYSNPQKIFRAYRSKLLNGVECIFIGLPCQVAALKKFLSSCNCKQNNLLCVDIICHGVPPFEYLDQHLKKIESIKKQNIKKVTFRYKSNYLLQCFTEEDSLIYSKDMYRDPYFLAFISGLTYRDNCYKCRYAQEKRVSDITLGDYSGLGSLETWNKKKTMVSLVMCHTDKGLGFINALKNENKIECFERPTKEPFTDIVGNPQLHHASIPHAKRNIFLIRYGNHENFDDIVKALTKKELYYYYATKPIDDLRNIVGKILTRKQKDKIKAFLKPGKKYCNDKNY